MAVNTFMRTERRMHMPTVNSATASNMPAYRDAPERKPRWRAEKYSWKIREVPTGDISFTRPEKMKVRPKISRQRALANLIGSFAILNV